MPPKNNYRSYQLLKFHSINTYTQSNIQAMFYGRGIKTKQGIQFTKYYRENGCIRAFAHGQGMNELFPEYDIKFLKMVLLLNMLIIIFILILIIFMKKDY